MFPALPDKHVGIFRRILRWPVSKMSRTSELDGSDWIWSRCSSGCRPPGPWWRWSVWAWCPIKRVWGCSRSTLTGTGPVRPIRCCSASTRQSTPLAFGTNRTRVQYWTGSGCLGPTSTTPTEEDSSPSTDRASWSATRCCTWGALRRSDLSGLRSDSVCGSGCNAGSVPSERPLVRGPAGEDGHRAVRQVRRGSSDVASHGSLGRRQQDLRHRYDATKFYCLFL